jgi:subtilase family serine protease
MLKRESVFLTILGLMILMPVIALSGTIELPVTGQTKCYDLSGAEIDCIGTGQDGELRAGVEWPDPRFTNLDGSAPINGECVLDRLTGLIWPRNGYQGYMNWYQAIDFANTITLCGLSGWHLPNINQIESLVNVNKADPAAWLNAQGFYSVQPYYWSSTTYAVYTWEAWHIRVGHGNLYHDDKDRDISVWPVYSIQQSTADPAYPANIWSTGQKATYYPGDDGNLQRGVAWPDPRFTDNGDGTVTDNLTGLMWLRDANCMSTKYPSYSYDGNVTWEQALDFVKGINNGTYSDCSAGYYDWRLPNRKELMSLVDRSRFAPALSAYPFVNVENHYFSSTSSAKHTKLPWHVKMRDGYMNVWHDYDMYVWPVSGGLVGAPVSYSCDKDEDGYINLLVDGTCTGIGCVPLGCHTEPSDDCDDNDPSVNTEQEEGPWGDPTCSDGKDNNCNGFADTDDPICQSVVTDLFVSSVTGPSSSVPGATINVDETTNNKGPGSAPASITTFYWSDDITLDAGDTLLGSRSVPVLSVNSTSTVSFPVTIPSDSASGTYYIIAEADAPGTISETNENNNTRHKYINVKASVPDLVVLNISTKPWSPSAGQDITVTTTVKNKGAAEAGAFSVDIYKHRDTAPYPGLTGDAYCSIPGLAAGAKATCVLTVSYAAGGSYIMWAQVDTEQQMNESNENNNINDRYLTIQASLPDLVVSNITTKPWSPSSGQDITVTTTVKNQGTAAAGAFSVDLYKHRDTAPYPGLTGHAYCSIPGLAAGAKATCVLTVSYAAGSPYTMWAQVDTQQQVSEANENNNTRHKYLNVQASVPDLVVSNITTKPWSPSSGQDITVTTTVKNQGTAAAGAFSVDIYKHRDTAPSPGLTGDVHCSIPGLAAGAKATCVLTVSYAAGGSYIMWAQVDTQQQMNESNENNNIRIKSININP